mgnify:CR=1 FL=1
MKIRHSEDHGKLRQAEYPSVGEQLDAIWKHIASLPPDKITSETAEMLNKIQSVKTKYRKPSQ